MTKGQRAAQLSGAAKGVLTDLGEWSDEAGIELIAAGLAVPTQLELTEAGKKLAAELAADDN